MPEADIHRLLLFGRHLLFENSWNSSVEHMDIATDSTLLVNPELFWTRRYLPLLDRLS